MAVGAIIGAVGSIAGAALSSSGALSGGGAGAVQGGKITLQPYDYLNLAPVGSSFNDFLQQENNLPSLNSFANEVNTFANKSWQDQVLKLDPHMLDTVATIGQNANSLAKGLIPQDVKAQIEESSAYSALQGGYGGTGMGRNLTARDLGLTSLSLESSGASMAGSEMNLVSALNPSQMNVSDLLFSPQQILQRQDQQTQYNTDLQDQVDFANAGHAFAASAANATLGQQQTAALGQSLAKLGQSGSQLYNAFTQSNNGTATPPLNSNPGGAYYGNPGQLQVGPPNPGTTQTADSSLQASLNNAGPNATPTDFYGSQGLGLDGMSF
jgi:hypothetical protein